MLFHEDIIEDVQVRRSSFTLSPYICRWSQIAGAGHHSSGARDFLLLGSGPILSSSPPRNWELLEMFAHLSRSPRLALVVLSSVTFVTSAPLSSIVSEKDATGVAQALSSGVDVYRPYTSLAGAAYCPLSSWSCGGN